MKTFKKSSLPDTIEYKGHALKLNMDALYKPEEINGKRQTPFEAANELQRKGFVVCLVECLANNLKGRVNFHGEPYTPQTYIYSCPKKTTVQEMGELKIHSQEWFKAAFEGVYLAEVVKQASIRICHAYGIKGQSDPAYIANIIDDELNTKHAEPFNKRFFKTQS